MSKLSEREIVALVNACGKRVCTTEEHHGCPYGDEGCTDCVERLEAAYDATFMQYAEMVLSDAAEDKQIWYSKGKVDHELRRVCGKYFVPWEERYGETTGGKDHE